MSFDFDFWCILINGGFFFLNIKIGCLVSVRLKMIPYLRSIREGLIVQRGPLVKAKMGQK